jgi:hypothetical protein
MRAALDRVQEYFAEAGCDVLLSVWIGFVTSRNPQGDPIRDGKLRQLSGMFCTNCTGTLQIGAVH